MKKTLSLFLVLVMFISVIPVSSYAKYKEEITFRGIPFGTKYEDVVKQLKEEGIELTEPSFSGSSGYYSVSSVDTVPVAGYDMNMNLRFVANSLNDPVEKSVLFWAGYYMNSGNETIINGSKEYKAWVNDYANDMEIKLSSIYGRPDKYDEKKPKSQNDSYKKDYIYYGADGTSIEFSVVFQLSQHRVNSAIYYNWETGEKRAEVISEQWAEQQRKEKAAQNGGTGGL